MRRIFFADNKIQMRCLCEWHTNKETFIFSPARTIAFYAKRLTSLVANTNDENRAISTGNDWKWEVNCFQERCTMRNLVSSVVLRIKLSDLKVPLSEFPYCANSIDICVPRGQLNDIYSASQPAFWYVLSVPASSAEKLMKIEKERNKITMESQKLKLVLLKNLEMKRKLGKKICKTNVLSNNMTHWII